MMLVKPKVLALAASSTLVLLIVLLFVQHLRHGWPFSLHHGEGTAHDASPSHSVGAPSAHPRAEVQIPRAQLDAIGVRIESVREETISQPIRTVATVVPDEARVSHVHSRVSGWIERLYVSTTGEQVRAGQPLAGIFSQELLSSQSEYLAVRRVASSGPRSAIADGARARLEVLGMSDAEIRAIERSGEPRRLVTVHAPRSGVVLHRGISVGTAVDPSTEIVTVVDLSQVWVLAEVSESDIPSVRVGTPARIELPASGHEAFEAQVAFLHPTLSERTRTLRARFVLENVEGSLRPGIYGTATFLVEPRRALTVPRDAVVDTGETQHLFVVSDEGRFVPRQIELGTRLGERVEVREGVVVGEQIVASGVFLIDSESRLRASGGGTGHSHGGLGGEESSAENEVPSVDHAAHAPAEESRSERPARRSGASAPVAPSGRPASTPPTPPTPTSSTPAASESRPANPGMAPSHPHAGH